MPADDVLDRARAEGRSALFESEAKALLAERGVRVPPGRIAGSAEATVAVAEEIGYPVVLKVASPDVLHKSDVGGVRLGLRDADEVARAYGEVMAGVRARQPRARLGGVLVEQMVAAGQEVIVGLTRDAVFGPVVMVGLGGVFVEVLGDVAFRVAPIGPADAEAMLGELRGAALLAGARGRTAVDRRALVELLLAVAGPGGLGLDERVAELDLNPVIAHSDGAVVADARVVLRAGPPLPGGEGERRRRPDASGVRAALDRRHRGLDGSAGAGAAGGAAPGGFRVFGGAVSDSSAGRGDCRGEGIPVVGGGAGAGGAGDRDGAGAAGAGGDRGVRGGGGAGGARVYGRVRGAGRGGASAGGGAAGAGGGEWAADHRAELDRGVLPGRGVDADGGDDARGGRGGVRVAERGVDVRRDPAGGVPGAAVQQGDLDRQRDRPGGGRFPGALRGGPGDAGDRSVPGVGAGRDAAAGGAGAGGGAEAGGDLEGRADSEWAAGGGQPHRGAGERLRGLAGAVSPDRSGGGAVAGGAAGGAAGVPDAGAAGRAGGGAGRAGRRASRCIRGWRRRCGRWGTCTALGGFGRRRGWQRRRASKATADTQVRRYRGAAMLRPATG